MLQGSDWRPAHYRVLIWILNFARGSYYNVVRVNLEPC